MNRKAQVVLVTLLLTSAARPQPLTGSSETAAQLLSDAKSQASIVKSDLATVDFFAVSWKSNATTLALYQKDIGALRGLAPRLDAARKTASRWQQTAIDRIIPLIQEFTTDADAELRDAGANQNRLNTPEFQEYFKLHSDLANEYSALIGSWADYAKTKDDLDRAALKIHAQ